MKKTNKWVWYTRGVIHLHRLAVALEGIHRYSSRLLGSPFTKIFFVNAGEKIWWGWDEAQIMALGKKIIEDCSTHADRNKRLNKIEKIAQDAIAHAEKTCHFNLRALSDKELVSYYLGAYQKYQPAHALMDPEIDAVDATFETFLQDLIKSELGDNRKDEYQQIFKSSAEPAYNSYVSQQEIDVIRLALKKTSVKKAAETLHDKYWWTALGWENMRPHSLELFEKLINTTKKDRSARKKLKDLNARVQIVVANRKTLLKKYHLSARVDFWLSTFDRYAYLHDLRKEMQVKTVFVLHRALLEIARRRNLNPNDLEWMWPKEIAGYLSGRKISKQEFTARKKYVGVVVSKSGIVTKSGRAAKRLLDREYSENVSKVKLLNGIGVTNGSVRGRVKVCNGYEEALRKIRTGDILVCGMTLPDYLPAMKKAAAIVTDEGGITCHAAIVSRELGKICIVGTKIATQVFKDGDIIEVDANRGIVKLVKRG